MERTTIMDYQKAQTLMEQVMEFVYDYVNDYPDTFAADPETIEQAYNKVKNG